MTRQYDWKREPDRAPAACYPERVLAICPTCSRWRMGLPIPLERRQFPIIDMSVLIPADSSDCALHIQRPAVRPFAEVDTPSAPARLQEEA